MKKVLFLLTICISTVAAASTLQYKCQDLGTLENKESAATSINQDGAVTGYYFNEEDKKVPFIWKDSHFTSIDMEMGQRDEDAPLFIDVERIVIPKQTVLPYFNFCAIRKIAKTNIEPVIYSLNDNSLENLEFSFDPQDKQVSVLSVDGKGNFLAEIVNNGAKGSLLAQKRHAIFFNNELRKPTPRGYTKAVPVALVDNFLFSTEPDQNGKFRLIKNNLLTSETTIIHSEKSFEVKGGLENFVFGQFKEKGQSPEGIIITIDGNHREETSLGNMLPIAMNSNKVVVGLLDNEEGKKSPAIFYNAKSRKLSDLIGDLGEFKDIVAAFAINNNDQIVGVALTKEGKKHAVLLSPMTEKEQKVAASLKDDDNSDDSNDSDNDSNDSEGSNDSDTYQLSL